MSKPCSLAEMERKLIDAYAEEADEFERRRELWSAQQGIHKDVWDFVDRINQLDEDLKQEKVNIGEREKTKCIESSVFT